MDIPEILKKKIINTNLALILDKYGYSRNIEEKMINMNSPLALILDKYGYSRNIEEKNDKHEFSFSSNP